MEEENGPATDKQGRVIDKVTGRPLRDRSSRSYGAAAFKGKPAGKPHPGLKRLEARQRDYDAQKQHSGRKRPGSLKKN